ncbi:MAG: hypothetical protein MJZ39_01175 [Bacteroidales bacterium]|nr:hypothetical protein [Bacteroidales bacterium]
MKAWLRYFMLLAICLIPFTFIDRGALNERFPIVVGVTLAVTIGYWVSYAIIERKKKQQEGEKK